MAGITMCSGKNHLGFCPKKDYCYRHTAEENPWRQSYFMLAPFIEYEKQMICREFWDARERK